MDAQHEECTACGGRGGRWDDDVPDQWYWCDSCNAREQHYAELRARKAKQTVARLREIYREGRRFEVTVGGLKLVITATERVELAFASEAEVVVKKLTDVCKANPADSLD